MTFVGIESGLNFISQGLSNSLALGASYANSLVNGLALGTDGPKFAQVAGVSTVQTSGIDLGQYLMFGLLALSLAAVVYYFYSLTVKKV